MDYIKELTSGHGGHGGTGDIVESVHHCKMKLEKSPWDEDG